MKPSVVLEALVLLVRNMVLNPTIDYVPSKLQCIKCLLCDIDCSSLPFELMKVTRSYTSWHTVDCTEFQPEEPQ